MTAKNKEAGTVGAVPDLGSRKDRPNASNSPIKPRQAILRAVRVTRGRHCYLYNVDFVGEEIVSRSADPECDMARALLARGVTGVVQVMDGQTGKPRTRVNVEKAAGLRTVDEDRDGTPLPKVR